MRKIPLFILFFCLSFNLVSETINEILIEYYKGTIDSTLSEESLQFARKERWPLISKEISNPMLGNSDYTFKQDLNYLDFSKEDPFFEIVEEEEKKDSIRAVLLTLYKSNSMLEIMNVVLSADIDIGKEKIDELRNIYVGAQLDLHKMRNDGFKALEKDENGNFIHSNREVEQREAKMADLQRLSDNSKIVADNLEIQMKDNAQTLLINEGINERMTEILESYLEAYMAIYGNEIQSYLTLIDTEYQNAEIEDFLALDLKPHRVTSQPEGAEVFLGNTSLGTTPLTLPWTLSGEIPLKIKLDNYKNRNLMLYPAEADASHALMELTDEAVEQQKIDARMADAGTVSVKGSGQIYLHNEEWGSYETRRRDFRLPPGEWSMLTSGSDGYARKTFTLKAGEHIDLTMLPKSFAFTAFGAADLRTENYTSNAISLPMGNGGIRFDAKLGNFLGFFIKSALTFDTEVNPDREPYNFDSAFLVENRSSLGYLLELGDAGLGFCLAIGPSVDYIITVVDSKYLEDPSYASQLAFGFETFVGAWLGVFYAEIGYYKHFEDLALPALETGDSFLDTSGVSIALGIRFNLPGPKEPENTASLSKLIGDR